MIKNTIYINDLNKFGQFQAAVSRIAASNAASTDTLLSAAKSCLLVALIIGVITILGDSLRQFIEIASIAMFYMVAVVISAILFGLVPSLFASIISILCYDYFFTEPIYHFEIASTTDAIGLVLFGTSAVVTSQVASRGRAQRKLAERREWVNAGLYLFSRQLSGLNDPDELFSLCAQTIGTMLRARIGIFVEQADILVLAACFPKRELPDAHALESAKEVWQSGKLLESVQGRTIRFELALSAAADLARKFRGFLSVYRDRESTGLGQQERQLSDALVDLAAVAIERVQLAEELERVKLEGAADQLRSVILASLSHDLRTPLTSILGSLSSLQCYGEQFDSATRAALVETAYGEAERLTRFVSNLLDISRIGSGAIKLAICPVDLSDIVATAVRRAKKILNGHKIHILLPPTLPMLQLDPVLTEQILFNILDNAAKYSAPGTAIQISGERCDGSVLLTVSDEGRGIPEQDVERIFDRFYRVNHANGKLAGTGLGLTVCRGFIEAQGGLISAGNRKDKMGAVFTLRFPVPAQAIDTAPLLLEVS